MEVRWQFYFEYEELKFEKPLHYLVPISMVHAEAFGLPLSEFEAEVTIEGAEEKHDSVTQLGKIYIQLPGNGGQTEGLAYSLVNSVAQQINFLQGRIKIDYGFVSNELLPETPEEKEEVGDNRFSMTVQLKPVPDRVPFDSSAIKKVTNNPLLQQFNDASNAQSPIDQFIGFFKILEGFFGGHPIKPSLKNSTALRQLAFEHLEIQDCGAIRRISQAEFEKLVDDLADTRHQCAHLRDSGFGLTYGDHRVQTQVIPLLAPLKILARETIRERIGLN